MQGGVEATDVLFPGGPLPDPAADDPPRPFVADDLDRLWLLDFHFPHGLTPLGLTTFVPAYAAGTRAGAVLAGTPGSDGFSLRLDGPHLYVGPRVPDATEQARRADGFEARWRARLAGFEARWAAAADALDAEATALLVSPPPATAAMAADRLEAAAGHEARAWRLHFEEMYVLLAGHLGYRRAMAEQGVPPAIADACLAGFASRPSRADAAMLDLAHLLRQAGVHDMAALEQHPGLAERFAALLADHGQRADGIADVQLPSWQEVPERVFERVVGLAARDLEEGRRAGDRAERRRAVRAEARARASDPAAVDALVADAERANWIWWNEEHNGVIDLRASLPLRKAALEAGAHLLPNPPDALLCGFGELVGALRGAAAPPSATLLDERRQWLAHHRARRRQLPEVVGASEAVDDPILAEVFGLEVGLSSDGRSITGMGASRGRASGPARVVCSADDLDRVAPGDVLVCEATSPSWGFAFAVAAAVVCEKGGRTTHAAICAREYEIPCVVSAAGATKLLRDGGLVEVDGDAGVVRLLDP